METINNVVSGATKVIWGEPNTAGTAGEEPVSGQTGAGTATKPFDQGNQSENTPSMDTTNTTSPEHNPATADSTPKQKQQGGDRPTEEPGSRETAAINDKTQAAEDTQNQAKSPSDSQTQITSDEQREKLAEKGELPHDPNDHSGEPMKMHNAGAKSDPEGGEAGESMKQKTERSASVAHEGGGEHGKEKGTGEQWVKTSGVAADGGDFDVTKPGAGKEATRIMEQKGIKTESATIDPNADKSSTSSDGATEAEKVSKIAKLKEKMHIGSSKHA